MKYLIVVTDGAGDNPLSSQGGRTPLEMAKMPNINELAHRGIVGSVKTVPDGISPGSDSANLSLMGYNPKKYLTGRSPLEAVSIGVEMKDDDMAFRANLVTLDGDGNYEDLIVKDHSAGDISTEDATVLVEELNKVFSTDILKYFVGTGYRHCLLVNGIEADYKLTPPHDILDRRAGDYLPQEEDAAFILDMMKRSYEILKDHPINKDRIAKGKNPANSLWIWGQGKKPELQDYKERYGIKGSVISAVDLIKGISICAGMESIEVSGANGTVNTNYEGKVEAAIKAFEEGYDMVYVHMEGPDEASHQGSLEDKITALERIDGRIVKHIVEYLRGIEEPFRVLVAPDHKTPLEFRTHTSDPVPFVLYDSQSEKEYDEKRCYNEKCGKEGPFIDEGDKLVDLLYEGHKK